MALPPKGNLSRPLFLAARSSRMIGILYLLIFGLLATFIVTSFDFYAIGPAARDARAKLIVTLMGEATAAFLTGYLFLIVARKLSECRRWAVTLGLVNTSINAFTILGLARWLHLNSIGILFAALWMLALIDLIVHLAKSYAAIRFLKDASHTLDRGFEVVPVLPAVSIAEEEQEADANPSVA